MSTRCGPSDDGGVITREEVMPLLLEACPSFREHWETDAEEWGRDEERGRLYYIDSGELAAHLVKLVKATKTTEFPAIFDVIERFLVEGDEYVKELAAVGYLENIQNHADHAGIDPELFVRHLKPESRKAWDELNIFWEEWLPLAKMFDFFIRDVDTSKELVDEIEGLLLQHFRETEMYEELSVPLASYEPAGGEYLYDTAAMKKLFTFWLEKLRRRDPSTVPTNTGGAHR
jgi:hypothetical protein